MLPGIFWFKHLCVVRYKHTTAGAQERVCEWEGVNPAGQRPEFFFQGGKFFILPPLEGANIKQILKTLLYSYIVRNEYVGAYYVCIHANRPNDFSNHYYANILLFSITCTIR